MSRKYAVTITCRRPANRARDDWHVRPDRVAHTVQTFFGESVEMTLSPRKVQLCAPDLAYLPDLASWEARMATVMHCLYLDVPRVGGSTSGRYELPTPMRVQIKVTDEPTAP
ncbi:hypothetical protein [Streptomyces sp. SID10815]|uniref:hypothetical protein n=1 Tax=Streptomyces sp. SID10815 TaxID=2706027 RepID=UPI0013CA2E9F|nr:hypothetical protein [Streptomyces sp. SID10815]NEA52368.1 hypothetical protein [Streptomyces sp. SID10815]